MGRILKSAVALVLVAVPTAPSYAIEIIQTSSNQTACQGCFTGFNAAMGTLNSVRLEIATTNQREGQVLRFPIDTQFPIAIEWTISGQLTGSMFRPGSSGGETIEGLVIPTSGSGAAIVNEDTAFAMTASGEGSFLLDPLFFIYNSPLGYGPDIVLRTNDPGLYSGSDVTFVVDKPANVRAGTFYCDGPVRGGDEGCNNSQYRLIYDFTPFDGVPEPSTWAMMLLGFGLIGGALRSRRGQELSIAR